MVTTGSVVLLLLWPLVVVCSLCQDNGKVSRFVENMIEYRIPHSEALGDLQAHSTDWGNMVKRVPAVVVSPRTTEEVRTVMRHAYNAGISVQIQGGQTSAAGQSVGEEGGVVLNARSLVGGIVWESTTHTWTALAGNTWSEVLAAISPQGGTLTDTMPFRPGTVGGSIAAASQGTFSAKYGRLTNKNLLLEMEVVTGTGSVMTCSPTFNSNLYDLVRGGMGNYGVITKVKYQGRDPTGVNIATYFGFYVDGKMFDAQAYLTHNKNNHDIAGISGVQFLNDPQVIAGVLGPLADMGNAAAQQIAPDPQQAPLLYLIRVDVQLTSNAQPPTVASLFGNVPEPPLFVASPASDAQIITPLLPINAFYESDAGGETLPSTRWINLSGYLPCHNLRNMADVYVPKKVLIEFLQFPLLATFSFSRSYPPGHNLADDGVVGQPLSYQQSQDAMCYIELGQALLPGADATEVSRATAQDFQDIWETYFAPRHLVFSPLPQHSDNGGYAAIHFSSLWFKILKGKETYDPKHILGAGNQMFQNH